MKQKAQIRQETAARLSGLSESEHVEGSRRIAEKLYETDVWKLAGTVGITLSVECEVDTYGIIQRAWSEGKRVAVPKCDRNTRRMAFREIHDFEQLEIVYMHLREPVPAMTKEVEANEIDLLIVPGIAYTLAGDRLGYGGGYYDRFLATYQGPAVALAFSVQIVPEIPMDEHDRRVNMILTNQ